MTEESGQDGKGTQASEQKHLSSLQIGIAISGAVLLIIGLWAFVGPSSPTQKKDFIQAVGVLLAALVGLGGLYFTAQNLRLTRENTEKQLRQTRENTEKQLRQAQESTDKQLQYARESQERTQRLTEQGQITERFTRAIEQMGASDEKGKKLEKRLGGIYALERIATDSPERDYSTVMEVLTAYVRENAPRVPNEATARDEDTEPPKVTSPETTPTDIQAILNVIGRRQEDRVPEENRTLINLSRADLQDADLQEADLTGALLMGADLSGAILWGANLGKANLTEATLKGADLTGADLTETFLYRADLSEIHLSGARLKGAILGGANLKGANLLGADLKGVNLREAILAEANLRGANLSGANLKDATLGRANLTKANLREAILSGVDLGETQGLTQARIEKANGDKTTKLPETLHPPRHWTQRADEQANREE